MRPALPRPLLLIALALAALPLSAAPAKWAAAIDKFAQADAAAARAPGGVVFVGSSSIVRWKTLAADFPGSRALNRGFGGSELEDSLFHLDRLVLPHAPDAVVLYAGDNDLGAGKTPERVAADFAAFCARLHAALPQARLVYIAIKPSPKRWALAEQGRRANALIAAHCAKDPRRKFADIWTPMLGSDGQPRPELFVEDKLHLSAAGYALWTPIVAAALER